MKLSSLYLSLKTDLAAELIQPCNHCQLSLAQTSSDGFSENLGFDGNSWVKKSVSKRIPAKPHDACMDEFQQFQFEVAFVDPCMGQVVCSNKTRLRHVCIAPISSQKKKNITAQSFHKAWSTESLQGYGWSNGAGWPSKTLLANMFFTAFSGLDAFGSSSWKKLPGTPPFSCWAHLFCCL